MRIVHSAGIVPVKRVNDEYRYLIMRSYAYWDFPKGKLDPGEVHLEAALRETEEESGLFDLDFVWGMDFFETEPYPSKLKKQKVHKVARYYLAEVKSGEAKIRKNEATGVREHDEFKWLTYDEALKLPLYQRIKDVLTWAQNKVEGD